jgi:hypothetical protein
VAASAKERSKALHFFFPFGSQFRFAGINGATLPLFVSRGDAVARVFPAKML